MKKLPKFLSKLRESEKVETMGRTARRRQGVFFGRLGVPERSGAGAAGSGRCAVWVFFGEGGGRAVRRARSEGRCGAGAGAESRRGVCFSVGAARSTAGVVRAAEGSGGEVNAVGTAVRALVEAPVGFEKALEGIGCGAGEVGRGGVGGEHVGGGAGGVGRRESGGGEHRAERGDRGEEKRRSGAAASARGAAGEGGGGRCGRVGGAGAGSEEQQHEHHGQGVEVEGLAVAQLDGNHRGAIEAEGAGFEIGREQRGRGAVAGRRVGLPVDG